MDLYIDVYKSCDPVVTKMSDFIERNIATDVYSDTMDNKLLMSRTLKPIFALIERHLLKDFTNAE